MSNHIITKSWINNQINTREGASLDMFIGRALGVLVSRQTEDEKRDVDTKYRNNKGFAGNDARSGTLTYFYWKKNGKLENWMREKWTRNPNRLGKYWAQLDEVAQEKANRK